MSGSKGGERYFLQVIRQLPPNELGGVPFRGPWGQEQEKDAVGAPEVFFENRILPSSVDGGVIEHENVTSEDEATLNAILKFNGEPVRVIRVLVNTAPDGGRSRVY